MLFIGVPFLIFANLFFKVSRRVLIFAFCFLLFAFLTKGDTGLLGGFYGWGVDTLPLGGAFRDSTKFFAPLFLFAGVLIGISVESFVRLFRKQVFSSIVVLGIYVYLLFLVYPAISGQMDGVLRGRKLDSGLKKVADQVSKEEGFLRTLWFPEHHPFSFDTEEKPALDAKKLVDYRLFALLNTGTLDRFNFLNSKQFLQWLDIFGIKYLVFSGDTRQVTRDVGKEEDWEKLLDLAAKEGEIKRVDWTQDLPVYQTESFKPRVFGVDKLFAVVGSDDIYQKLIDTGVDFSIGNSGFAFFEDGKFDPGYLGDKDQGSVSVIFNETDETDLTMSFLQKYFVSMQDRLKGSQWAIRTSSDYLDWKYEFLINGVDIKEFDYGRGVAFSTVPGEELDFQLEVPQAGEYVLAVRSLTRNKDEELMSSLFEGDIAYNKEKKFEWHIKESVVLPEGILKVSFKNTSGFHGLNTLAVIPKSDFDMARQTSKKLLDRVSFVKLDGGGAAKPDLEDLVSSVSDWSRVEYAQENSVRYTVSREDGLRWLIFSDTYHPMWRLRGDFGELQSFPVYSALNGFYVGDSKAKEGEIFFEGQKFVRMGLAISVAGLVAVGLGYLYYLIRDRWKT